jgi:hypothetical protein
MLLLVKASAAQVAVFLVGLVLSLVVGMALAASLDGPGGLLFSTVVSAAGLLGAAVFSQTVHDHLLVRTLATTRR